MLLSPCVVPRILCSRAIDRSSVCEKLVSQELDMKANEFVEVLRKAMPTRESLEEYGIDDDNIHYIQATFLAVQRIASIEERAEAKSHSNPVSQLISEYDCSNVEVGLLRFASAILPHKNGSQIAVCEADPVVLENDASINLYDHSTNEVSLRCAVDASHFLDALGRFVEIRGDKLKWLGNVEEAGRQCADLAGGPEYEPFYRMLCAFLAR